MTRGAGPAFDARPDAVLRRLAALPEADGHPELGLAICDAAGAITFQRPVAGFSLPRNAACCPLWPLFQALTSPGRPVLRQAALPGDPSAQFVCYAFAAPRGATGFGQAPVIEATMLVRPDPAPLSDAGLRVGSTCRLCPRPVCPARREASILPLPDGAPAGSCHWDQGFDLARLVRNSRPTAQAVRPGRVETMGRRVLLIEDEPNIIEAISFILSRDGWTVHTHADGVTAMDTIARTPPDLIILDVMLPGRSGYDILRDLRADPATADLPVLMLTARGQTKDRELAERLGVTRFMTKPFSNAEVLENVRALAGA